MTRKKLERFQDLKMFTNVVEIDSDDIKSALQLFLGRQISSAIPAKAYLELGCGRGEYTIAHATKFPGSLCIGVDIQGERIWVGAKEALECSLGNVLFVRCYVEQLAELLEENTIDEIWLPYPDPHPGNKKADKRLTSLSFHELYRSILKAKGSVHLITDNHDLYFYTLDVLAKLNLSVTENTQLDREKDKLLIAETINTSFQEKNLTGNEKIYSLGWEY